MLHNKTIQQQRFGAKKSLSVILNSLRPNLDFRAKKLPKMLLRLFQLFIQVFIIGGLYFGYKLIQAKLVFCSVS